MSDCANKTDSVDGIVQVQSNSQNAEPENFEDVDLSVLLDFEAAQCEDDPDLIVELIDLYLAGTPQQLSVIKDSVFKADEISLKLAVHNLKGSSANLGVISITRLCEELEQMNFTGASHKENIHVKRLEQAFARVRRVFLAVRQNRACVTN